MAVSRTCDVCKMARQRVHPVSMKVSDDVVRYTLRREIDQRRDDGLRAGRYQKSSGGIDLCGECWEKICAPRMNPKKANNRAPAQRSP